jgi:hypothetical protein
MRSYTRAVEPAPEKLVTNGKFTFGTFNTPFKTINPLDADNPLPIPVPRALKNLRLKEWEAFQFGNKEYFMLAAVYNAKSLGVVQLVVIDIAKEKKYIFERKLPPWKLKVGRGLADNITCSVGSDFAFFIHNHLGEGKIRLTIDTRGQKGQPDLSCSIEGAHDGTPIAICQPFGENRALYSHKALMPVKGSLTIGEKVVRFGDREGFMIVDDHKGYYPFTMKYDWVTTGGYDGKGRLIGFNLTDNQVLDHHRYNENCLWVDDAMVPLPPIKVDRPQGTLGTWLIRDSYGRVDLRFRPVIDSRIDINALVVKTKYRAPYGFFEGHIVDEAGERVIFDDFFGMGEKKFIQS